MNIYAIKALAVTGVAAAVLGGGALLVGVSTPSSGAGCVAAPAVSGIATRRVELTQILTPAGSALVSNGSTGLAGVRQTLSERLGCEAEQVAPAVPAVVEGGAQQLATVSVKSSKSPNCRIV